MTRYKTTVDFIHICRDFDNKERLNKLARNLGLRLVTLKKYEGYVDTIAEYIKKLDAKYHDFEPKGNRNDTFLGQTLHSHLASDLRSIIVLIASRHNYQANIILRHLLESFIMTLWGDLASNFRGSFSYLLDTKEWKPYRAEQRMTWELDRRFPNRSIKERLERIRLLNFIKVEGKEFYMKYFSKVSKCDLILLLSLPICVECMKIRKGKVNYQGFHLDPKIRKTGKEDEHARYKTDFGFVCSFCGKQKLSQGFAYGIPEPSDMLDMLIAISEDKLALDLNTLQKGYSYLSEEYVHFSTTHHPDTKPRKYRLNNNVVTFWGFEGVIFCLVVMGELMHHYFDRLAKLRR